MSAGRPPKYATPEELLAKADEYFKTVQEPITITGLCLFLGFCSRQSLYDYIERPEFSYIAKRLKMRVEHAYEMELHGDKGLAGPIFALKNMGWKDTQEREINVNSFPAIVIKSESDTDNTD
jgi:hypothetical protein